MDEVEKELLDSLEHLEEKAVHFTQLSPLQEPSLNQLRSHIKKITIPLLIKLFHSQLDLIPSSKPKEEKNFVNQEFYEQLKTLDEDLQNLQQWCQSCRDQLHKALSLPEEELKNRVATSSHSESGSSITKSFTHALTRALSSERPLVSTSEPVPVFPPPPTPSTAWWKKWCRKKS